MPQALFGVATSSHFEIDLFVSTRVRHNGYNSFVNWSQSQALSLHDVGLTSDSIAVATRLLKVLVFKK
jgi:hypothetical protein